MVCQRGHHPIPVESVTKHVVRVLVNIEPGVRWAQAVERAKVLYRPRRERREGEYIEGIIHPCCDVKLTVRSWGGRVFADNSRRISMLCKQPSTRLRMRTRPCHERAAASPERLKPHCGHRMKYRVGRLVGPISGLDSPGSASSSMGALVSGALPYGSYICGPIQSIPTGATH